MPSDADIMAEANALPHPRAPATLGEVWSTELARSGLDTIGGVGKPMGESYEELRAAVENAYPDKSIGELARERSLPMIGFDQRIQTLGALADEIPDEEARKAIEPLKDVRRRAAVKAQKLERDSADVASATYGVSGMATAFAAGVVGQLRDPLTVGLGLAGGMAGGTARMGLLRFLGAEALSNAASQALVEPYIQAARGELGLEAGAEQGAVNVLQAAIGGAGVAGILRGGAHLLERGVRATGLLRERAPPGVPPAVKPALDEIGPGELHAAADYVEARQLTLDVVATPNTAKGRDIHAARLEDAAAGLEQGRPQKPIEATATTIETGETKPIADAPQFWTRSSAADTPQQLIRPNGERMTVRPMVVEMADVTASHTGLGDPNPSYPAQLQPRDRSGAASRTFVAEKAGALEPELLGNAPTAATGAPVVGPDGVVESGNGRVLMLQRVYERHPERAAAYRSFLEKQGYDLTGFEHPVLVRVREGDLPIADRVRLAQEANVSQVAGMAPRERAIADAGALDRATLGAFVPGDIQSAANAKFVQGFASRAVAAEERPNFIDANNRLSAEGVRRIAAALVMKGWGDAEIVTALFEATDPSSLSILKAFADVAPQLARLKAGIEEGRIAPELDPSAPILDAFRLVETARAGGPTLVDRLNQIDAFGGAIPPETRAAVRMFFRDDAMKRFASQASVATKIDVAIARGLNSENSLGDMFGVKLDALGAIREGSAAGRALGEQPVGGPGTTSLQAKLAMGLPIEEIMADPIVADGLARAATLSENPTIGKPGYGTPAYKADREFHFAAPDNTTEKVIGWDNGVARLVEVAKHYGGGDIARDKVAVLIVGPPASGKSTFAERAAREYRAAIPDPDDAKKVLPEFVGGVGSGAVHEESSQLARAVTEHLIDQGMNVVIPRVGHTLETTRAVAVELRGLGYDVKLVNVVVEENEAFRRSVSRFLRTGRIVGGDYFLSVDAKPSDTYIKLRDEGLFSETLEIDANGKRGSEKVLDGKPTGELARRILGQRTDSGVEGGAGAAGRAVAADQNAGGTAGSAAERQATRAQGSAETSARTVDAAAATEAERILAEQGDLQDLQIIDPETGAPRTVTSAREELADAATDSEAAAALRACYGGAV